MSHCWYFNDKNGVTCMTCNQTNSSMVYIQVANAVGAALSQVSGVVDHVVDLSTVTREKALHDGESLAITRAMNNGALADTVVIVEKSETQLAYLKGGATRVQVKAVGNLNLGKGKGKGKGRGKCRVRVEVEVRVEVRMRGYGSSDVHDFRCLPSIFNN